MNRLRSIGPLRFPRSELDQEIDLGGGRTARPEDLLEGHFQRLAGQMAASQDVSIQVSRNKSTAIRVSAPTLAPLAQVAEELAVKFPTVQPAADFRSELHRALEEAHRRQMEARAASSLRPASRVNAMWVWLAATLLALAVTGIWLTRRRR